MKALVLVLLAQSVHLDAGQDAPFAGQLIADAEHIRRERINERNAEAFDFAVKHQGSVILTKPQLIAVVAGAVVVGAALGVAVTVAVKK